MQQDVPNKDPVHRSEHEKKCIKTYKPFIKRNIQGMFKKRPNFCYKEFIDHFTEF